MSKNRALVTGGCGFIGSNLATTLRNSGWVVDVVDDMSNGNINLLENTPKRIVLPTLLPVLTKIEYKRKNNEIVVIQGDFADDNILAAVNSGCYDVIFHQAAIPRVSYSVENPYETTRTNISKTIRLFEAASNGSVDRIVFASSSSVYGGADLLPTSETCGKDPKSPYAWQKSSIEDAAKIFCNLYNIDIVCLRYFNVFGPGQYGDSPYSTALAAWCHAIKNNLMLRSDGDGTQSRDLCYIENIVSANILAANYNKKFKGKCYNVACGDRISNNEILEYLKSKFKNIKVRHAPWRAGDIMHTQADISQISNDLGYEPSVRFWKGIDLTIKWWGLDEES